MKLSILMVDFPFIFIKISIEKKNLYLNTFDIWTYLLLTVDFPFLFVPDSNLKK